MRYIELVGVYHADGSLLGELRYIWGKLRGTAHCTLCDITHGRLSEKCGASVDLFETRLRARLER